MCLAQEHNAVMRHWKGGSQYPISLLFFWKIFHIPKINMANIPKIQKALNPISLKLIQVSRIPLSIYKNIPYPFKFFANVPVSLKTLPGLQWCRWGSNPLLDPWQSKKTNMHIQHFNCYSDVRWSHDPWQPSDLMPSHRITRDSHQNSDSQAMTRNSHLQSSNRDSILN